ncbi:hypothetical protein D9M71_710340 [compost metagenome]
MRECARQFHRLLGAIGMHHQPLDVVKRLTQGQHGLTQEQAFQANGRVQRDDKLTGLDQLLSGVAVGE